MDFIFMLTRNDQTIEDCLDVLDLIAPLGIRHIGFKDVGVSQETLRVLANHIRMLGAVSYLEVVNTSQDLIHNSIKIAANIGVDRVMGGQDIAFALTQLPGKNYFPFVGRPFGHPTKLGGMPETIITDCQRIRENGCAGADLLAYRAVEAEPLSLVHAARQALGNSLLIVAGNICTPEQIRALSSAGVDAFTVGSAIFDGSFSLQKGSLLSQLRDILAAADSK